MEEQKYKAFVTEPYGHSIWTQRAEYECSHGNNVGSQTERAESLAAFTQFTKEELRMNKPNIQMGWSWQKPRNIQTWAWVP